MNAPAQNLPARRSNDPVAKLNDQLSSRADQFRMVLPSHIDPAKFQRTILTAVQTNPALLNADRTSLILACMKAAQDGLLPDGREAVLVVYKTRKKIDGEWMSVEEVQYQSMVYGVRKKILQSREVTDITAKVVYRKELESGAFLYEEGTERMLRHKPMLDLTEDDARDENIIAAYSMATYKDGSKSYKVMRRFEIDKRRQASKAGALGRVVAFGKDKGKPIEPSGPWVDWYPEQAEKTVLRSHSKMLPSSGDIVFDVEEMEMDMAARSTASALVGSGGQPAALPAHDPVTGEVIEDQSGTEAGVPISDEVDDAAIDAEMAPLRTDSRGMTEVSEEEARALDAGDQDGKPSLAEELDDEIPEHGQANDGTLAEDNPTAAEGPADEQRGEAEHDADAQEEAVAGAAHATEETDDAPAWAEMVKATRQGIAAAKNKTYLKSVMAEFDKHIPSLPDEVVKEIDALANAKRRQLDAPKAEGQG